MVPGAAFVAWLFAAFPLAVGPCVGVAGGVPGVVCFCPVCSAPGSGSLAFLFVRAAACWCFGAFSCRRGGRRGACCVGCAGSALAFSLGFSAVGCFVRFGAVCAVFFLWWLACWLLVFLVLSSGWLGGMPLWAAWLPCWWLCGVSARGWAWGVLGGARCWWGGGMGGRGRWPGGGFSGRWAWRWGSSCPSSFSCWCVQPLPFGCCSGPGVAFASLVAGCWLSLVCCLGCVLGAGWLFLRSSAGGRSWRCRWVACCGRVAGWCCWVAFSLWFRSFFSPFLLCSLCAGGLVGLASLGRFFWWFQCLVCCSLPCFFGFGACLPVLAGAVVVCFGSFWPSRFSLWFWGRCWGLACGGRLRSSLLSVWAFLVCATVFCAVFCRAFCGPGLGRLARLSGLFWPAFWAPRLGFPSPVVWVVVLVCFVWAVVCGWVAFCGWVRFCLCAGLVLALVPVIAAPVFLCDPFAAGFLAVWRVFLLVGGLAAGVAGFLFAVALVLWWGVELCALGFEPRAGRSGAGEPGVYRCRLVFVVRAALVWGDGVVQCCAFCMAVLAYALHGLRGGPVGFVLVGHVLVAAAGCVVRGGQRVVCVGFDVARGGWLFCGLLLRVGRAVVRVVVRRVLLAPGGGRLGLAVGLVVAGRGVAVVVGRGGGVFGVVPRFLYLALGCGCGVYRPRAFSAVPGGGPVVVRPCSGRLAGGSRALAAGLLGRLFYGAGCFFSFVLFRLWLRFLCEIGPYLPSLCGGLCGAWLRRGGWRRGRVALFRGLFGVIPGGFVAREFFAAVVWELLLDVLAGYRLWCAIAGAGVIFLLFGVAPRRAARGLECVCVCCSVWRGRGHSCGLAAPGERPVA
ncbi:hypothetical protein SAMN03159300_10480 [Janthinobacterium sp. 344]|nr:hypothetical protein SAMN03159300_10480 [Janthinobacterium sp. 344]